jgi:tyrosine-protein phosphatase MSG5
MSLALKRTCPFTLTIYQNNDIHTSVTMDPDPYAPRFLDRNVYNEWRSLSPSTDSDTSQRSPSPPKRPRNTKNLSLNVPSGPQNSSAAASAPASPFRSPRFSNRRPPNLTINIHSLHRHPSTPELHTSNIVSPFVTSPAPYTASQPFPILNLDTRRNDQDRPKPRHTDPLFSSVPYGESVEREKAYPDGPRLIIEPNIWLYAEPDLELAKTYDVVVNVAREVGIPFIATETLDPFRISPQSEFDETSTSPFSPPSSGANPSPSVSSSVSSGLSPQLPLKATETVPTSYKFNDVEYMHIPWDHNSSLTQDLPGIVDYILERSEEGKKVLVHCQVSNPL